MAKKQPASQPYVKTDQIEIRGNEIFSPLRQKWLKATPEERVRQEFLIVLMNEYGYSMDQIDEEAPVTSRGAAQARADFLIWRTPEAKQTQEHALIPFPSNREVRGPGPKVQRGGFPKLKRKNRRAVGRGRACARNRSQQSR